MMRSNRPTLAALSTFALVSCSSGGATSTPASVVPVPLAPVASSVTTAPASFRIVVPAAAASPSGARRAFVGAKTASIGIVLTPTSGSTGRAATFDQNLSPTASGCASVASGGYTCTLALSGVAVGAYSISFTTYDGPLNGSGAPTGNILSANQTYPFTVVANTTNTFDATLDGIPASITLTPVATSSLVATSSSTPSAPSYAFAQCAGLESAGIEAVTIDVLDAQQEHIVGPGAPTVSLTSNSASVTTGTPSSSTSDVYPLGGPTTPANFGAPGSNATLTVTATTPAETATSGGIPTVQLSTSVSLTLAACGVVDRTTDANAGTVGSTTAPPGAGPGAGTTTSGEAVGDLRYVLQNAPAGARVVFALGTDATVTTAAPLPPIEQAVVVDGAGMVAIDGGSATAGQGHRVFFVDTGTVVLRDLTIQNALAHGGDGGSGGNNGASGGGGCGCGAGLFVNQSGADVSLESVAFIGMSVVGGSGGTSRTISGPGGGGGLDFNGGDGNEYESGGGGGGVLGPGAGGTVDSSGSGGFGGGAGGAAQQALNIRQGSPGAPYGSNPSASALTGGFGGGGGGNPEDNGYGREGGSGGFGGGGGGAPEAGSSGAGGFGGGGGGSTYIQGKGAPGGPFGGQGGADPTGFGAGGGGGAALGAAVFVDAGSLTTASSSSTATSVTPGAPGANQDGSVTAAAGQSDATPVFDHAGTVNGIGPTATNGAGVPGALTAR